MKTVQDILKEKNADYNISMFRQLQTLDYQHKVWHAEDLVHDFYQNNWLEDRNCHISVGGLDSITLLHFIRSLGYDADRVPAISCSSLEDKSIQKVHKQLGVISLPPVKRDDGTVWNKAKILQEFGFPVLSKEIASKIELLQNPTEKNATVRHAIITGETGEYGGYQKNSRMQMSAKWLRLFGGYENEREGVQYGIPNFKVSSRCCYYLKEKPCDDWAKMHNSAPFLGLMASEGGRRAKSLVINGCNYWGKGTIRSAPYADELPHYPAAPNEPVSASQLIRQQQDILARNGENQRKRMRANQIEHEYGRASAHVSILRSQLADAEKQLQQLEADLAVAQKDALDLQDESTDEIERSLQEIEQINIQVRANCDREKAEQDAAHYAQQYQDLTKELEKIRHDKYALLDSAKLPLPGLSVEDGELTYNGKKWDCMSGADQLICATAIVRAINPKCGFVLLDKLEQLDADQLHMFGVWLKSQQLQVIATRVSTGPECSIIIEDGFVAPEQPAAPSWQKGVF